MEDLMLYLPELCSYTLLGKLVACCEPVHVSVLFLVTVSLFGDDSIPVCVALLAG